MKLILLGAPGSGKGTLAKKIIEKYHVAHISTGDLLRAEIKSGSSLGQQIQTIIASGKYVPDSITNDVCKNAILNAMNNYDGFILDGYPRTIDQVSFLNDLVAIDLVVYLKVDLQTILDRISSRRVCSMCGTIYNTKTLRKTAICDSGCSKDDCLCANCGGQLVQRKDDNPDVAKERIQVYETQTQPVIDLYKKGKNFIELNASLTPDEVFQEFEKAIRQK